MSLEGKTLKVCSCNRSVALDAKALAAALKASEPLVVHEQLCRKDAHAFQAALKDSEVIVEAIFDSVVKSLRTGDKIEIRGFGSFRTRQRQPRVGRNPKTGSSVDVPQKRVPFFKVGKRLRELVNA